MFAMRAIQETTNELGSLLTEILEEWVEICNSVDEFPDLINQLASQAGTADHIFTLSKTLNKKVSNPPNSLSLVN